MNEFKDNVLAFLRDLSQDDLAEMKTGVIAKMPVLNADGRAMMERLNPLKAPPAGECDL